LLHGPCPDHSSNGDGGLDRILAALLKLSRPSAGRSSGPFRMSEAQLHFDWLTETGLLRHGRAETGPSLAVYQSMATIAEKSSVQANPIRPVWWVGLALAALVLVGLFASVATYNGLVTLDQGVKAQWAEVENVYQRRADLVPNLVSTVKGAAAFEQDTMTAVTEARARVGQVSAGALKTLTDDPEAFARFQKAQDALSSSLSRLMVVAERYPELHATQNFRDLQSQLEGTENRIAVARMRFNEAAQAFNTKRGTFPTVVLAGFFTGRFGEKPYFEADTGAKTAPKVDFRLP
jgi:LemA protein